MVKKEEEAYMYSCVFSLKKKERQREPAPPTPKRSQKKSI
jgi:hypothetical protein